MLKAATALMAIAILSAQCAEEEDDNTALLGLALLASGKNSCSQICPEASNYLPKTGDITTSETWSNCTALTGYVFVKSGATLTIPAGSCVAAGVGTAIFVERGADIVANGTAANPIIFTSNKAEGQRSPQDWGGLVIIGNGQSTESSATTEGPVALTYSGGTDNADSSGSLQYVRIEFCGAETAAGDELNCLSSYAVGSGTTYQYIQAHMGRDDAFEWWGGAVNASYLLATGTGDDAFDMDQGYRATVTNAIDYRYPASAGITYSGDPRGLEWDGSGSGTAFPYPTTVTLNKFSLIGDTATQRAGTIREKANATLTNGIWVSYPAGLVADNSAGPGSATTTIGCSNVRGDQGVTAASGGDISGCTPTSTSEVRSTYVTTDWNINDPLTAPVLPTVAGTGTEEGSWWSGWTYWRHN